MHVATYTKGYPDKLKTALQWARAGFLPKEGCDGEEYWTNWGFTASAIYFTDQEVRPATEEELTAFWRPYKDKRNAAARRRRAENKKQEQEKKERQEKVQLIQEASRLPVVPCDNPSGIIVIDTETTGLYLEEDEILQISVIDGDGRVLLNTFVHPIFNKEWSDAMDIHGITPEMVADAPYPDAIVPILKGIFESAHTVIGYNIDFDLGFIRNDWRISPHCKIIDVMKEFAEVYGEWSDYYGGYKWQSLSTAAAYYDYDFDAHDSLEDVKATLHVYRKIHEAQGDQKDCLQKSE